MKTLFLTITMIMSFNSYSELRPMSDDELRNVSGQFFDPIMDQIIEDNINDTSELSIFAQIYSRLKETGMDVGLEEQLRLIQSELDRLERFYTANEIQMVADAIDRIQTGISLENLQGLIGRTQNDNLAISAIAGLFAGPGINADVSIEGAQTRGHYEVVIQGSDGTELARYNRPDFYERINIENIRFGDTPTSIGSIYISDIDFAPGNKMTITIRP